MQNAPRHQVQIVTFPDTPVALMPHLGDPSGIERTVQRFVAWRQAVGLPPGRTATFNILHGDPATTPPDQFRLDLCVEAQAVAPNDAGVVAGLIPGGRCALLRQVGSEDGMIEALRWLSGIWLPGSGEQARGTPMFCQRVRFFPDVPEHAAVTDIYLPLR
ncbi:AraC family transcriptional regulator [Geminicoccus roseus]|uniref:AraC family transcriptional regulator n=1 Tax=Geminicoccus roseus TaxID=404900 RepID=UPI00041A1F15|nr:GyrI-like domain-containing protein [Geminicoccus roseus]